MKKGEPEIKGRKILLGQLGRGGDCLYATAVARQIKHDYPACHLTWAISSQFRSLIDGNLFVDEIWEISQDVSINEIETWNLFKEEAEKKKHDGEYDDIFLTQVHPGNFHNYDGTSRSSLFRGYPNPITVTIKPVVRLSDTEIENVKDFIVKNNISDKDTVVLFECASTSGQSFVTTDFAQDAAKHVLKRCKDVKFILTSKKGIITSDANILNGSVLSFKENAELTKYCTLFIGCSSGISWLATSDWAKSIPQIQLLDAKTHMFASMIQDARYFGLPTDQIMEMQNCSSDYLADCILVCLQEGFMQAKKKYHTEIPIKYDYYFQQIYSELLSRNKIVDAFKSLNAALERYRHNKENIKALNHIIRKIVYPYLSVIWNNVNDQEKKEIDDVIEYRQSGKSRITISIKSYFSIIRRSFLGGYTSIARIFLKDIILRMIYSVKLIK